MALPHTLKPLLCESPERMAPEETVSLISKMGTTAASSSQDSWKGDESDSRQVTEGRRCGDSPGPQLSLLPSQGTLLSGVERSTQETAPGSALKELSTGRGGPAQVRKAAEGNLQKGYLSWVLTPSTQPSLGFGLTRGPPLSTPSSGTKYPSSREEGQRNSVSELCQEPVLTTEQ